MKKELLVACALAFVSADAWADVVIRNGSKYEITHVNVSPASVKTWGPDHLGEGILKPKDTLTLKGVAPGTWDFQLVFRDAGGKTDYKCVIQGVELDEKGDDSTFDDGTLDACYVNTNQGDGEEGAAEEGGEEE